MIPLPQDEIIDKLVAWGESCPQVRAMLLTSTLAGNNAPVDIFSDYDVQMFVTELTALSANQEWHGEFGSVLVKCCPGWEALGVRQDSHLILYEDGTKIDFTIAPLEILHRILAEGTLPDFLDVGYRVLFDKDGLTTTLPPPTGRAFIPAIPTAAEYADLVSGFWWNSTYVAKYLWRDDLLAVKFMLDGWLKQNDLRPLLEWSIEIERGWNWKPGHYGRGLLKALDPDTRRELIDSYAGGEIEELWESFFRTMGLFRKIAIRVGEHLGYAYLHDLDARVTAYHQTVRNLDKDASREELAAMLRKSYQGDLIKESG